MEWVGKLVAVIVGKPFSGDMQWNDFCCWFCLFVSCFLFVCLFVSCFLSSPRQQGHFHPNISSCGLRIVCPRIRTACLPALPWELDSPGRLLVYMCVCGICVCLCGGRVLCMCVCLWQSCDGTFWGLCGPWLPSTWRPTVAHLCGPAVHHMLCYCHDSLILMIINLNPEQPQNAHWPG